MIGEEDDTTGRTVLGRGERGVERLADLSTKNKHFCSKGVGGGGAFCRNRERGLDKTGTENVKEFVSDCIYFSDKYAAFMDNERRDLSSERNKTELDRQGEIPNRFLE